MDHEFVTVSDYEKTREEHLVDFDKSSFSLGWDENEKDQLTFDINKTDRNEVCFDLLQHESSIYFRGQEYVVKSLETSAQGYALRKKVVATHVSFTMQEGYQYATKTGRLSAQEALSFTFGGSPNSLGYTFEVIDPDHKIEKVEQENFGNANYLKLVQEIIDDYVLVMVADNKHLKFYPREDYGNYTETQIRYKASLDSMSINVDTYSMCTQIKGFGKKKEDDTYYFPPVMYTSPESNKWGIRIQQPVEDERYTIVGNMLRRLKNDLQDYPATTIAAKLKTKVPLSRGDFVMFIYEPMNINYDVRVVGIEEYPFVNTPPTITLSNTKKTIVSILAHYLKGVKK
ncbi:phage tail protein [Listeria kieliensis]